MPTSNNDTKELGLELLRIKAAINQKTYSEKDVDVFRSCLAKRGNLSLIAAGYALSENLGDVKETAVTVLQEGMAEIRLTGRLPSRWAEMAILEGLLFADPATLLRVKEDVIDYLRRLLIEPSKIADFVNASALLRRLAGLHVKEAGDLLRKIDEMR